MADLWHPVGGICITDLGEKRLGHGESFCLCRLRIEASQISFGWDISLRAEPRRRRMVESRWLREADGTRRGGENLERSNHSDAINGGEDSRTKLGENQNNQILNPNLMPLGFTHQITANEQIIGSKWREEDLSSVGAGIRLMELGLEDKNVPVEILDGKKRQRIMESSSATLGPKVVIGSLYLSASSGDQSSRGQ
ncbi:hypothetical protein EPI10_033563 [Gossypium australe]|uniref:Uncharacterized protein n=1 Tax=Gossypium australe TaxID=47621 RepID=A0A5B6XAW7_9ROSI|nr:hypothetical protein EPI10_033563 [Gossypium australe]